MSNSSEPRTVERLRSAVQRTATNSRVVRVTQNLKTRLANSRIRQLADQFVEFTRASFIFHWLTREPDPEVVVIDLRETYTVGPIIKLLDASIARVSPWWRESRLARSVQRVERLLEQAADTRPGRTLRHLLEPPEPPSEAERDDDTP